MTLDFLLSALLTYKYVLLFPLAAVEGPLVALISGFFVSTGTFELIPAFSILFFADFLTDMFYFLLGRKGRNSSLMKRFEKRMTYQHFSAMEGYWKSHVFLATLISKWAYGLSTPLLISAGIADVSAPRFFLSSGIIIVVQYSVLMGLGMYFGNSIQRISDSIALVSTIVTIILIVFFGVSFFLARSAKQMLKKIEKESK
jgi:membrane protein DedA with SNARE-associated domain